MSVLVALLALVAADPPTVKPGTVVRWAAPGTQECRSGARSWQPLGDACFFPIDLVATGEVRLERTRSGAREALSARVAPYPYPEQRLTVPEKMVDLSPSDLIRARREEKRVAPLFAREGPARFTLPLASPLGGSAAGGNFGSRRIFNDQPRSPHSGADFRAPAGAPVYAVADGTVALAEPHFFSGNSVFVDHGGGLVSMSFHLSEILVRPGQTVRRGQLLGRVGATGRAVGPHLHFALRWHGARIDPNLLIGRVDAPEL